MKKLLFICIENLNRSQMAQPGYVLFKHESKSLNDLPDSEFDYAVTIGSGDERLFLVAREHIN